jgi:DNA polymerase (family 10)
MVQNAAGWGYESVAITDHSKGLKIARGMDEARLSLQVEDIDSLNRDLEESRSPIRVLRSLEMNVSPEGDGDMDPGALARLDLVLGAFHSKLRETGDQTDRYLLAVRNPTFHVLAHPRGRMFNRRVGLSADWPVVFQAAVEAGKALEIDAHPNRQDLDVELLLLAAETGVWISIGTDAHRPEELRHIELGLAAAIEAGIHRDQILNFLPRERLLAWAKEKPSIFRRF